MGIKYVQCINLLCETGNEKNPTHLGAPNLLTAEVNA